MDKRYQVFVSSTYEDLQNERKEIIQALLELDCIPSGMELFPAASDDQWSLIKNVINDCDYYLVIIGGRYGSTNTEGMSYTEMEYRYALESDIPIIGFLHSNPEEIPLKYSEKSEKNKKKLEDFINLVKNKMVKYYNSPADLGSKVSRSIIKLIKDHPGIGWVRADELPSEDINKELLSMRKQNDNLTKQLEQILHKGPVGIDDYSQGKDTFELNFSFISRDFVYNDTSHSAKLKLSWNEIFYGISPIMINEAPENEIKLALNEIIEMKIGPRLKKKFEPNNIKSINISTEHLQTIIIQFRAIGMIAKSEKQRSLKDIASYWKLTPFGDNVMTKLRAIKN